MKKLVLPALLGALIVISSCRTETVNCTPGYAETYAVGFDYNNLLYGKVIRYVANTDSVVDSSGISPGLPGDDSIRLFIMQPGYDYKLQFKDTASYFFNNITLSGIKQQTIKHGFMDSKKYGCIERVVSYDLNGKRYDISANKYDYIYIRPL